MIISIDPGSEKTGTAVLQDDGELLEKHIVPTEQLISHLGMLSAQYDASCIVMGNGTNHKHLLPLAEVWGQGQTPHIPVVLVDEKFTTVEGRHLYWQHTPRRGWRRFFPLSFQYPPEPVDDFVAWIIGLRYLQQKKGGAKI